MDKGWIKLHRKILDNEKLMVDRVMLQIFIYLLVSADRKGNYRISRFKTSELLGLNPSTFKDGIERLKRHQLITSTSTTKYTEIHIVNWARYQSTTPSKNKNDTKSTPLIQEYKKQEYITTSDVDKKIIKFLEKHDKVTNPEGYLKWLKTKFGEIPRSLLDIEFNNWVEYLTHRGTK